MKKPETRIKYPTRLLKIESGQQFGKAQLQIFDTDHDFKDRLTNEINYSIDRILKLHRGGDNNYTITLPEFFKEKLGDDVKQRITKELSGYELRVLTAVVALAQISKSLSTLSYIEEIDRVVFEFQLGSLYRMLGIDSSYSKRHRDLVKDALMSLHYKEFLVPFNTKNRTGFKIKRLIELLEYSKFKDSQADGDYKFRLMVDACFISYQVEKAQTYFYIPSDVNLTLKKINPGRPNPSIELFIKCLYQAKHCSTTGRVEYSFSKLSDIMNLNRYKRNNNYSRIKKTIDKAFETALKLDLVESVEEDRARSGEVKYMIKFAS
ncbi:hypothetical protein [Chondrinema litorale]|uniref:hypothetical protein n=1 Tax=Chondrinema litorale TaxID=2994555 RepID=UPI00254293B2|nr:hypothetical protein [Chondrinema litorale]UZR99177.1 hypothetical protein OQ292_34790 [Chondrinema litorale]